MSVKAVLKNWCIVHKKYHGMANPDCSVIETRSLLGEGFIKYLEGRGIGFEDVYPVRMAKKKGKE